MLCAHGIDYYGTDIVSGPEVDFVIDFEEPLTSVRAKVDSVGPFSSILVFNVLEHTFDPVRILDNVFGILRPGGICTIVAPAIWPLHDYPIDSFRILPDFYCEYAKRRHLELIEEAFQYLDRGPVDKYIGPNGKRVYPRPTKSSVNYWYSKIIHRVFHTFGAGTTSPSYLAIGAVIRNGS